MEFFFPSVILQSLHEGIYSTRLLLVPFAFNYWFSFCFLTYTMVESQGLQYPH